MSDEQILRAILKKERKTEMRTVATSMVIGFIITGVALTSGLAGAVIAAGAMTVLVATGHVSEDDNIPHYQIKEIAASAVDHRAA